MGSYFVYVVFDKLVSMQPAEARPPAVDLRDFGDFVGDVTPYLRVYLYNKAGNL